MSGCPREGYRENKGKKTKEKKKRKTHKSRQERQGCKQLLLGGREGQASVVLIDSLNGLCWRVALLSYSNHWQRHDCLGSSLDPSCWALWLCGRWSRMMPALLRVTLPRLCDRTGLSPCPCLLQTLPAPCQREAGLNCFLAS